MLLPRFILLVVGAYLLGSVPVAYLVSRWRRHIDIRQHGSGNVGMSNVASSVSKSWAIAIAIFDLGTGMLVVYLAKLWGLEIYQQVIVGISAIAGHDWPVFLGFSGGRGVLTSVGAAFALVPWVTVAVVVFALLFAPFRQLPLGVLLGLTAATLLSWFASQPFGSEKSLPLTLGVAAILMLTIIRRLALPRTVLSASTPTGELLLNRLVFDRDIRDRGLWLGRTPGKPTGSK